MAVYGPSGVGLVAAFTYPASGLRAMLVLPTVIEAGSLRRDRTMNEGFPYANSSDAQGDDAVKYSSTDGRVVGQCYRRGSVVLALLLARRHCCRKIASLARTHAWLHRDQTSRTLPDGHRQPSFLRLNCHCW